MGEKNKSQQRENGGAGASTDAEQAPSSSRGGRTCTETPRPKQTMAQFEQELLQSKQAAAQLERETSQNCGWHGTSSGRMERSESPAASTDEPYASRNRKPKRRAVDLPYDRRRHVTAWLLVALWAGFIFWASAHTGSQLDYGNDLLARAKAWLSDAAFQLFGYAGDVSPVGHFCEYFVFGLLVARATAFGAPHRWRTDDHLVRWRASAMTAGVTALYALSDELHQLFVPNRSCDPADWAVDMVAATIASLIAVAVVRRGQRKRQASRTQRP
ncbi:MAG: VanZ family protein [Eggerthellaceae bacterium]|jgi:hypothetical protein